MHQLDPRHGIRCEHIRGAYMELVSWYCKCGYSPPGENQQWSMENHLKQFVLDNHDSGDEDEER